MTKTSKRVTLTISIKSKSLYYVCDTNLTTIGAFDTFCRVFVPQRLINQSLYQEILLLQKFDNISGKVLRPKKISLQPQKRKWGRFLFIYFLNCDFNLEISQLRKKGFHANLKNVNQNSVRQRVQKFWFICLFHSSSKMCDSIVMHKVDKPLQIKMISGRFYTFKNRHLEF